MGYIEVHGADVEDGRIKQLKVWLPRLPPRVIDRETAVAWMRDGHSLIPVVGSERRRALVLVEAEDGRFIRDDTAREAADLLPDLPPVGEG